MSRHVGRITLAITLIAMGAVLISDNVWDGDITGYAVRLWPALLILLGLEWVAAAGRAGAESKIGVDTGAVALLVIIGLIMANSVSWMNNPFRMHLAEEPVRMEVPNWRPNTTSAEVVLTGSGSVEGLQAVTIEGGAGRVTVEPGDEFRVELTVRGYGPGVTVAEENARRVSLQIEDGRITAFGPADAGQVDLAFRVVVPSGIPVNVETSSGEIAVQSRLATVSIVTASGPVRLRDVKGDVAVTSTSGLVDIESVYGSVNANATSGQITVRDQHGGVRALTSSGSIAVAAAEVSGDYDLHATSGEVTVSLPAGASVKVDARAGSGMVSGPDWLVLGEGRGSATGHQGDGAHTLTLRTGSGNISVEVRQ